MNENESEATPLMLRIRDEEAVNRTIIFAAGQGRDFMRIDKQYGVMLNRRDYPHWRPDDFVKAFIDLIETKYRVKFLPIEEPDEEAKG